MKLRIIIALIIIALILGVPLAFAQAPNFPQVMPPNTVYGRTIGTGPGQAIPFSQITGLLISGSNTWSGTQTFNGPVVMGANGAAGPNVSSFPVQFNAYDSSSALHNVQINAIPAGTTSSIQFTDTSLANGFEFQLNASGSPVALLTIGSDPNIGIDIVPKGNGEIILHNHVGVFSGAVPVANSCAGFSLGAGSNDTAGRITFTSATTCSITFGQAFANNPFCMVTPGTTASTVAAAVSPTGFAASFGTAQTAFQYMCFGI